MLRGLDLTVSWGEVLSIFGPNGCGKTTLIKLLATLARPGAGQVRIAGWAVSQDGPALRRAIGVVTHQTFLYDDLTAFENLLFTCRMFGLAGAPQRILAVAGRMGVEGYLGSRIRTLSHGTQKRISIARALLHEPLLLLLDEPESGLDQEALGLLDQVLAQHRAQGGAAILTTHNVERGLALGSRVAILWNGRIAYLEERAALDAAAFRQTYARLTGVKV